jgi:hypothetical protein
MSLLGASSQRNRLPIDYHRKKLENPFFKRKGEKIISFAGFKTKLVITTIILLLAFVIWFFLISSFWKIKEVSITGADQSAESDVRQLITEQMKKRAKLFFPQDDLLFFQGEKLSEIIKNKYRFQKTNFEKKWPNKLAVAITEKPIAGIWNEADKFYYIDTDGYVVQEINLLDINSKEYPLLTNQSSKVISDSMIQIDSALINAAVQLFQKIPQRSLGINIDRFIIDNDIDTVKIKITEGPIISFDAKGDIDIQLNRLYALKTQKLKDTFVSKKMIDLRFGDKIYYQ